MSHLTDLAERIAALGPLRVTTRPAHPNPGGQGRPALLRIDTNKPRPANIGGGTVGWSGYFDLGGNTDFSDDLNAILKVFAECVEDIGYVAVTVRNAYEARNEARRKSRRIEARLARVLGKGRCSRGPFLVRQAEDGSVWLLDPEKQERGYGLRFASLNDLWNSEPSLRPIEWRNDDLIVAPVQLFEDEES